MTKETMLLCVIFLSALAAGQQGPSRPRKVLTPEQQEFQRQEKQLDAQRDALRAQVRQAYDAETAREKAGDCPNATTTYEANVCYGETVATTNKNLTAYERAIHGILSLKHPALAEPTPKSGPAGPILSPEENAAEFEQLEKLWHSYLDAACAAAFHQFGGGTGGPSFESQCHLQLMRDHMRELDFIYDMLLHM